MMIQAQATPTAVLESSRIIGEEYASRGIGPEADEVSERIKAARSHWRIIWQATSIASDDIDVHEATCDYKPFAPNRSLSRKVLFNRRGRGTLLPYDNEE